VYGSRGTAEWPRIRLVRHWLACGEGRHRDAERRAGDLGTGELSARLRPGGVQAAEREAQWRRSVHVAAVPGAELPEYRHLRPGPVDGREPPHVERGRAR